LQKQESFISLFNDEFLTFITSSEKRPVTDEFRKFKTIPASISLKTCPETNPGLAVEAREKTLY
jgi:hypothetical protein